MRDMLRNQIPFWYAPYVKKEPVTVKGAETGQYREIFSEPVQARAAISVSVGVAEQELFGAAATYDRVIYSVQAFPGLDEYAKVWITAAPENADTPAEYRVKRAARGLGGQGLWAIEREVR